MKKFNVFDPVLIRIDENSRWTADFYDRPHTLKGVGLVHYTTSGACTEPKNILLYNEETKHLHNTVGEFTKWIPKKGEPILVKDTDNETWVLRIFLEMRNNRYLCTGYSGEDCFLNSSMWNLAKPYVNPFEE